MRKRIIFLLAICFFAFVLPIIAVTSCWAHSYQIGGYNWSSYGAYGPFLKNYVDFYGAWFMVSIMTGGIPMIIYAFVVIIVAILIAKIFIKN
jgi:hypothetical protein